MVGIAHIELGTHHTVHAPLVVDETARPKLRQGQEPGAADHAALVVLAAGGLPATSRDPGHEGQAREVVARQEALAGQVAVGVEIGVLAVARLEEHGVLSCCITVAALGVLALRVRCCMALDDLVGHVHLLPSSIEQDTPAFQGARELLGSALDDLLHVFSGEPVAAIQLGQKLIHNALSAA